MQKRSCANRLQQLRKEFGISEDYYDKKEKQTEQPKAVIHLDREKEPKWIRKARNVQKAARQKKDRQERYDVAYWYLETFLKPKYAWEIYSAFDSDHFEDMVDYCYEQAQQWATFMTHDESLSDDEMIDRMLGRDEDESRAMEIAGMKFKPIDKAYSHKKEIDIGDDWEIPDRYWEEYGRWVKKHKIKRVRDLLPRRMKFLKSINKRNKGFRKRMMLLDPYTGLSMMSKKKMERRLRKILEENKKRTAKFKQFLEGLVDKGQISEDMMRTFVDRSEDAISRTREHIEDAKVAQKRWEKAKKDEEKRQKDYEKRRESWFKEHGSLEEFYESPLEISFSN